MLTPVLKFTLTIYVASLLVWFQSVSALDATQQTASFYVTIISTLGVIAGFIYTWLRDSRNRKWDAEDRERRKLENQDALDRQTALVKNEIRNAEAAAELSRQQQALKVRESLVDQQTMVNDALLDQQELIKTQRDLDSEKVEAALEKRAIVTRTDLDKESAEIKSKIDNRTQEILGEIHRTDEPGN